MQKITVNNIENNNLAKNLSRFSLFIIRSCTKEKWTISRYNFGLIPLDPFGDRIYLQALFFSEFTQYFVNLKKPHLEFLNRKKIKFKGGGTAWFR
jgi:hypothetical protein